MGARASDMEDLQSQWRGEAPLVEALNTAFDAIGFSNTYIESLSTAAPVAKRKYIKDSVWGMIEFGPPEMRLIDSPLLQRLRGIRQLGFSYLTYPSAEHSRFIHSLGIGHVVSRFIETIDRSSETALRPFSEGVGPFRPFSALDPLTAEELRYAALLHDVGHMPFSHASEFALASRSEAFLLGGVPIRERLDAAKRVTGKDDIKLAEVLSLIIVLSERFERFFEKMDHTSAARPQSLARIACLIAGLQPVANGPNIQDIISSSAVDSDKIDYVARDARACGISVGVDVSRIFLGGGLLQAARSAYDDAYEGGQQIDSIFVVNSSGADTLDEIVQARGALYQRVYLHPVTRTAEALLARALQSHAGSERQEGEPALAEALELWALPDVLLLETLVRSKIPEVSHLGDRIRNRNLPKKACALAPRLTDTQTVLKSQFRNLDWEVEARLRKHITNPFMEKLRSDNINKLGVTSFEDRILAEADALAIRLKSRNRSLPPTPLSLVVMTPVAAISPDRPEAWVFQNGEITQTTAFTNVLGTADASEIFKAVGFVFCDAAWREIVLQATRRVVYEASLEAYPEPIRQSLDSADPDTSIAFQRQTILNHERTVRRSNLDPLQADRVLDWAGAAGYFDDAPLLARRTAPDDLAVLRVADLFAAFDGQNGWRVKPKTIAAFANQVPPSLRAPLLNTIGQGTFLGQSELRAFISQAVNSIRQREQGTLVMLPLSPSSGGGVHAAIKDGMPEDVWHAHSVEQALGMAEDPILLFVDDNAASGVQSAAQLYSYSGMAREAWPRELRREIGVFEPIPSKHWEKLRTLRVGIAVAAGTKVAGQRLQEAASKLRLERFIGLASGTQIGGGLLWPEDVEGYLREVGRELIAQREYGEPFVALRAEQQAFCEERAFGYGIGRGVLATWVNVPSSTVTALWQPGRFQGRPWVPLLLRRGRFSELILG